MVDKKKQGKKNRQTGAAWERKIRKDLKDKCYLVIKNPNNVFWDEDNVNKPPEERTGVFDQARAKFNPFTKSMMMMSGGFPDFIAFKPGDWKNIGVEAKINGYLDPEERAKCDFLLHEHILSKILIASKDKNKRGKIIYKEYENKENGLRI